ncbi:non-specific lipid transfer protein GPI-anchored 5-like [Magnolia sinica]|uniref:non-specific lipid transfer protein GPI-anchored 5-like n=1 Tax=Magnolia sinica TaxID=86752 RepID=UPI00265B253D|nr:non-specific lipid transfer protein GPI-anchored 5-like [Magnolia sinica]
MALKGIEVGLAMVLLVSLWAGTMAQSGCTTAIISLSPCLAYITGNTSTPSSSCCSQLSNVVKSQAPCLCTLLNGGGSSLGLTINQTQALALPGACNVQTPPVSQCNGAAGPTTTPTPPKETPATPSTPTVPSASSVPSAPSAQTTPASSVPSGSGSKTVPSTGGDASDAESITLSLALSFSLLFISAYASSLTAL